MPTSLFPVWGHMSGHPGFLFLLFLSFEHLLVLWVRPPRVSPASAEPEAPCWEASGSHSAPQGGEAMFPAMDTTAQAWSQADTHTVCKPQITLAESGKVPEPL